MEVLFSLKNDEQVLLRSDSFNYEICRIGRRKDEGSGKMVEGWEPFKYFASLPQALNKLADMKVRSSDAKTLKQLAGDIEAARAEIMSVWSTGAGVKPSDEMAGTLLIGEYTRRKLGAA